MACSIRFQRYCGMVATALTVVGWGLAAPRSLYAQRAAGTVVGTVRDQSGAAVPRANVTITNRATRDQDKAVSSDTGDYIVLDLLPGSYDIAVEAAGFKKTTVSNIELRVQQTARVDFQLQVGQLSESVEVTGQASLLQTEEASVGTVIDSKRVVQLPLNGRGFLQLAFLTPGVSLSGGGAGPQQQGGSGGRTSTERGTFNGDSAISVGGNRENANIFLLDGTINTDRNFNMFAVGPSVDAIQEFKVQVNNYAPEFGGQGGGQINVITKAGSNSFHGAAWGYFRNQRFDAKNFFDRPGQPIPPFDRQQFGAAAGGKIIRDKLFWFGNYEGFRQSKAQTSLALSPSAQIRAGDFSNYRDANGNPVIIYDPNSTRACATCPSGYTRDPFPNNTIPADRINKISTGLLKYIDPPNQSTGLPLGLGYFFNNSPRVEQQDQMTERIDYVISSSDRFFGRYSFSNEGATIPRQFTNQGRLRKPRVQNLTLAESHTFGANKVNDFRAGFMRFRLYKLSLNADRNDITKQLGIQNAQAVSADPDRWGVPNVSVGSLAWGDGEFGGTSNARNNSFQFVDTFSWIKGRHNLKFGEDIVREQMNNRSTNYATGLLDVYNTYTDLPDNPGNTGSSFAQFLLGWVDTQNIPVGKPQLYMRRTQFALHFNDDYRVTSNLTLNLGLRWEYIQPWVEKYDNFAMAAFFQTFGGPPPAFLKANGYAFAFGGTGKPLNIDPVTGLPCTSCPKVSRGIILPNKRDFMPRFGFAYRPFGSNKWVVRGGGGVFFDTQIGNTIVDYARNPPDANAAYLNRASIFFPNLSVNSFATVTPGNVAGGGWGTTVNFPRAHIVNYNFAIQRQLGSQSTLTLQYIGSISRKLSISVGANNYLSNQDACTLYPAECQANSRIMPLESRYVFRAGGGDDRTQPIGACCQLAMPIVNANYNAGAIVYERRFSGGLSVLSSYTFSKSLDYGGEIRGGGSQDSEPKNWYTIRRDWHGVSNFDQKHRFITSWLWELPVGRGKKYGSGFSRAADLAAGGWSVNGIYSAFTGVPVTVYDYETVPQSYAPDCVGNPNLPRSQRSPDRWFDTSVFRKLNLNSPVGSCGRNILRAPGLNDWDFGIVKRFPVSERLGAFEFRAEFFNGFNHPIFGFPDDYFPSGTFGKISSAGEPRNIQFAVRYQW